MNTTIRSWAVVAASALFLNCGGASTPPVEHNEAQTSDNGAIAGIEHGASQARAMDNLGSYHWAITTSSPEAQSFFDQGIRLYYGFNHDEAFRSFAKAATLDPSCAMCFWGASLSLGPNYNAPMFPEGAETAWKARERAMQLASHATPVEQGLIHALSVRYSGPAVPSDPAELTRLNEAYAAAMREVAHQFTDVDDAQVLFAESMMDLNPWKLWKADGTPAPGTEEIVATLETVLARNDQHVGANHLYIHAVEASQNPGRAVAAAERLGGMVPGAGHLVHMPAHILQRVGRYEDSAEANRRAVASDRAYAEATQQAGQQIGIYGMYMAHNSQFLAYSASMEGRGAEAIQSATEGAAPVTPEMAAMMPMMEFYAGMPYVMMVRFAKWNDILATPAPNEVLVQTNILWHFARGMAFVSTDKIAEAEGEQTKLMEALNRIPAEAPLGMNLAHDVLGIANATLEGMIKAAKGDTTGAVARLEEAVHKEDMLSYDEPSNWWLPIRHYLGAVLLKAHRAADAEAVYRADLTHNPNNGWALRGLQKALEAQRKRADARATKTLADTAWTHADVQCQGSVL